MDKINKLINNQESSHLYPFFWQHGESDEKITEYMEKIKETGIQRLCIESRPHPEFLESGWWQTMDHIIHEAKRLNMRLWILDDAKFPTGYANGKVPENLKKVYLNYHRFDFVGPKKYAEINLRFLPGFKALMKENHCDDQIVKAIMVKNDLTREYGFDEQSMIDVTSFIKEKILYLDLPQGYSSIYVLYYTRYGGENSTFDYLNPIDKEATKILLNEVYQKHYKHYQKEFGNTIQGFFSDEPRFGNSGKSSSITQQDMVLPWCHDMLTIMEKRIPDFDPLNLVFLFHGHSDTAKRTRFEYMNLISQLYSENFNQVIGQWCHEHHVIYVGHIIEDNNADARLGKGAGHFFRAMKGQNIAGIDVIGGQLVPSLPFHHDAFLTGGSQGEFYHYALCKLGASLAKLDDNKDGTLMCEAFGAYGWVEGLKLMKWITDHLLSHGVNLIVPHAFNPQKFPDWDCPPHFYAHGNNPQFPYFYKWSQYSNRMCELLSGGYQVTQVGVLYHAFSSWSGDSMLSQTILKELLTHQIDCNIISEDYLQTCIVKDKQYYIKNYGYKVLIVPECEFLPKEIINQLIIMAKQGIDIIYINKYPHTFNHIIDDNVIEKSGHVLALELLSEYLSNHHLSEVHCYNQQDDLTYYHYHNDGEVFIFFNESIISTVDTNVTLHCHDDLMIYDAYHNQTYMFEANRNNHRYTFHLCLKPYESLVLVSGQSQNKRISIGNEKQLLESFDIYLKSFDETTFHYVKTITHFEYLGKQYPDFSGTIQYHTTFDSQEKSLILAIEEAYETVHVVLNDIDCGTLITPPYQFDLSKALKTHNQLDIYITNTLNRNQRDMMSMYIETDPLGIVGKVTLHEKKEV